MSTNADAPLPRTRHSRVMRVLARTAVLVLVALAVLAGTYLSGGDSDGGANIGAGLALFALLIVVAGAWGLSDGRHMTFPHLAIIWCLTAAGVGVALSTFSLIGTSLNGVSPAVLLADLSGIAVFGAGLVAIPALLGGLLGGSVRHTPPAS